MKKIQYKTQHISKQRKRNPKITKNEITKYVTI